MSDGKITFSVVLPILNEAQVFPALLKRLKDACESVNEPYEIIFVDDGSTDATPHLIRESAAGSSRIKYIRFSRNFGHQLAITAGINAAKGEATIVMDGDLQDPPELIQRFLDKWRDGAEVVYAVRRKRKEGFLMRSCYYLFYRLLSRIAEVDLPLDSGDFCLMDRKVTDVLKRMGEHSRYVRGIRAWVGFRQVPLPYEREARAGGTAKYSMTKLMRLAWSGVTSFSHFPLRLSGYLGYFMAAASLAGMVYGLLSKVLYDRTPQGWTSLAMALFFIGGVQLVMLSVVGNYVGRIYSEVQNRPLYVVSETNLDA